MDGPLIFDAEEKANLVECGPAGFKFKERIEFENNNKACIVGNVVSVSYTDASAKLTIATDQGNVVSRIIRTGNEQAWSDVSTGKVSKGDAVLLEGPVITNSFTDGNNNEELVSMVVPHQMTKVRLDLERTKGVSL